MLSKTALTDNMSITVEQSALKVRKLGEQVRNLVSDVTCKRFNEDKCIFLQSLILGTSTSSNANSSSLIINDFRKTGIAHLLSVSGFNVTIIIQLTGLLMIVFPSKFRLFFVNTLVLIYIFILIGIDNIPAVRAVIFSVVYLFTKVFGYFVSIKRLLLYYIFISLLLDVTLIKNISFLLTVGSILGIVLFNKRISMGVSKLLPEPYDEALSTTLSALLIVIPIGSFFFNSISVISPITNIIVTPFAPILTYLYLIFLLTSSWLREVIAVFLDFVLTLLFDLVSLLSNSQISEVYFPKYLMLIVLFLLIIVYCITRINWNKVHYLFRNLIKKYSIMNCLFL